MQTVTICRPNKRLLFAEDLRKLADDLSCSYALSNTTDLSAVVEVSGRGQSGCFDGEGGGESAL